MLRGCVCCREGGMDANWSRKLAGTSCERYFCKFSPEMDGRIPASAFKLACGLGFAWSMGVVSPRSALLSSNMHFCSGGCLTP